MGRIREQFTGKAFKKGLKTTVISLIVIAVVVAVNIFITAQDITADLTRAGMYSLLDSSQEFFGQVSDDIRIYYFAEDGQQYAMFTKILNKVEDCSDNISWEQKDPVKNPEFGKQFTDEEIGTHSFLVVDETNGNVKYLDYYDVITMTIDYNTLQYSVSAVDLEGRLVGAVAYVTNPELPTVYRLTGHGEKALSNTIIKGMEKENIAVSDLSLITTDTIPQDCDALLIVGPEKDLIETEYDIILDYMLHGGKLVMYADYITQDMPLFMELINHYGLDLADGLVMEGNSGYHVNKAPYELVPKVKHNDCTNGIGDDSFVICPYVSGIVKLDEISDTLFQQALLETSEDAYSKVKESFSSFAKEDGDIDGPFYVGMSVTETIDDTKSQFVLYTSPYMLADSFMQQGTYANGMLFYNTLKVLTDTTGVSTVRSVSIEQPTIAITASQAQFYGLIDIIVVPVLIIAAGIIVVLRRRRL